MAQLQVDSLREPDIADRASSETDWSIELRTRDRQRKLIAKIDAAIRRLYDGEYGYCEVSGEPISLARLEARPIATMTLEAQEKHERIERVSRDDKSIIIKKAGRSLEQRPFFWPTIASPPARPSPSFSFFHSPQVQAG